VVHLLSRAIATKPRSTRIPIFDEPTILSSYAASIRSFIVVVIFLSRQLRSVPSWQLIHSSAHGTAFR
jgi:hypothetical protein